MFDFVAEASEDTCCLDEGFGLARPRSFQPVALDSIGGGLVDQDETIVGADRDAIGEVELADDESAPDGQYSLRVTLEDNGRAIDFVTLMTGSVTSLRYENSLAMVEVAGQEFYVSEIYKVS